ncbi:hypothetical protein HOLleu_04465 [Holothuria leucospilota]|uniref:Uncharacterized protein n=1 Tax=Holothuria leucospilota TaxID=206669 RepID=A0A9Q1HMD9_HOLLE|nr:hypothetical protein HOLleu_04465 [Holothuria leucospilota]
MPISEQVGSLCTIRNISRLRLFLDFDTCDVVIRALVLSRLDYSKGSLLGCNASDIRRLQRIQNWAAELVCQSSKFYLATPCLRRLH